MKRLPKIPKKTALLAGAALAALTGTGLYLRSAEWNRVRKELEARGETFRLADLYLPEIPRETNFAATPALTSLRTDGAKRDRIAAIIDWDSADSLGYELDPTVLEDAIPRDLGEFLAFLLDTESEPDTAASAAAILEEISLRDTTNILDELSSRAGLADSQLVPRWDATVERPFFSLGQISTLLSLEKIFALHSVAAGRAGQNVRAANSHLAQIHLTAAAQKEPFVLSAFASVAIHRMMVGALWENLYRKSLHTSSLAVLQTSLGRIDFRTSSAWQMRCELAGSANFYHESGFSRDEIKSFIGFETPIVSDLWLWAISDIATCRLAEWYFTDIIDPLDKSFPVFYAGIDSAIATRALPRFSLGGLVETLPRITYEMVAPVTRNLILAQALHQLATTACAVERYSLEAGHYPETLAALVPDYLPSVPADPVDGAPVRYRPDPENGRYQIYSVGWDATDDGGATGETHFSDRGYRGDWTWRYPR